MAIFIKNSPRATIGARANRIEQSRMGLHIFLNGMCALYLSAKLKETLNQMCLRQKYIENFTIFGINTSQIACFMGLDNVE